MNDSKDTFDVLASVEKHIESLKPLLPRQAVVCIGEYPIKVYVKGGIAKGPLPIFIEKSSDEIYKWLPEGFEPYFVLDLEDAKLKTPHFWYNVMPYISKDNSIVENLKKKSLEKFHGTIIFSSVWDGIGSASLPSFVSKFIDSNIDSLSIVVLPYKAQPADAHLNAYAALEMCQTIEGATLILLDRDYLESYEGVDRQGEPIKGNIVANYMINLFLAKETIVDEVTELSKTFNSKLFTVLLITGASFKIYGTLENMLNTALLKPLLTFDLSSVSVLYVLLRMPLSLKDKLQRAKIELTITKWFGDKAKLKSIYVTEPIYTEDMTDRVDVTLLLGGFDTTQMFTNMKKKVASLKNQAVEKGWMTEDWQVIPKIEAKPQIPQVPTAEPQQAILETPKEITTESVEKTDELVENKEMTNTTPNTIEIKSEEAPSTAPSTIIEREVERTKNTSKPKIADRIRNLLKKVNLRKKP
jgi:hypothetical protein